jgi:hypothetical protein
MKKLLLLLALVLLPVLPQCLVTTGTVSLPNWPDASHYWGVMINATDAINWHITNHPTSFTEDKLVTDMNVLGVDYTSPTAIPTASATYNQARAVLTAHGISLGTYISGTNVEPQANQDRYPYSMVRKEDMPSTAKYIGTFGSQTWRQLIDPADSVTTTAFHNQIRAQWVLQTGIQWHFIDNAGSLQGGTGYGSWTNQTNNMRAINTLAQSMGARAVFNISMVVGAITPSDLSLLISAIPGGGICLESPWPSSMSTNAIATANAKAQYRQLLDSNIAVIMIGASTTTPTQATSLALRTWVATWRKPTDHLYMAKTFFIAPDPAVYDWQ